MKDPVDHIIRPQLPWRTGPGITECGLNAAKTPALTRDEYVARVKELGVQRTAMLTCMTCANTAARWAGWDKDPRQAVGREIEWENGWGRRTDRGELLRDELLAIAALVEAHREEFDAHIAQTQGRRAWNERKAEAQRKAPAPRPRSGL